MSYVQKRMECENVGTPILRRDAQKSHVDWYIYIYSGGNKYKPPPPYYIVNNFLITTQIPLKICVWNLYQMV